MKSTRLCENVSPETYAFWAKYEDILEELNSYAKKNNVVLHIRVDGVDKANGNQLWLEHEKHFYSTTHDEHITLFTSGNSKCGIHEDVYECRRC